MGSLENDRKLLADLPESELPRMAKDLERILDSVLTNGREMEIEEG
jgi:hypothetical protein